MTAVAAGKINRLQQKVTQLEYELVQAKLVIEAQEETFDRVADMLTITSNKQKSVFQANRGLPRELNSMLTTEAWDIANCNKEFFSKIKESLSKIMEILIDRVTENLENNRRLCNKKLRQALRRVDLPPSNRPAPSSRPSKRLRSVQQDQ